MLENLEPKSVFSAFESICGIPHGSGNMSSVSDWCVRFAKDHGLEHYRDSADNVIIIKNASPGYEDAEPVILQGHLDMVCEKAPDLDFDFLRDGIRPYIDGDLIRAHGTTLGADNGIAAAMILSILADNSLRHPRIEALLTTDEEVGMLGAAAADLSPLKGRRLINLDSEDEGVITVSCAGGAHATYSIPVARTAVTGIRCKVRISGLLGGHSGIEIDKGRANAVKLMSRLFLAARKRFDFSLVSVAGGLKDNAIPSDCVAEIILTDDSLISEFAELANAYQSVFRAELGTCDGDVTVSLTDLGTCSVGAITSDSFDRVIMFLELCPDGVQRMSFDIPGLVETSLNMGIVELCESALNTTILFRSSVGSARDALTDRVELLCRSLGGEVDFGGCYDAWEYRRESKLRELAINTFCSMYGRNPKIEAIHAGLECGVLSGKLPGLDCLSLGPDLRCVHTPGEYLSINSVRRVYEYIVELLSRCS